MWAVCGQFVIVLGEFMLYVLQQIVEIYVKRCNMTSIVRVS